MRFAVVFFVCGVVLLGSAWTLGGVSWLGAWPGATFLMLSAVYAADRPSWLGKRADGRLDPVRVLFFAPYLFFTWGMWHVFRRITPEPACNEVAPGVFLGRRPLAADLPPNIALVVDLTSEFPRSPAVRGLVVQALALDARSPAEGVLLTALEAAVDAGPVYIHCAVGHGRSALFAALVVLRRGHARTLDEAVLLLQKARPLVRLHSRQRAMGERLAARWNQAAARTSP